MNITILGLWHLGCVYAAGCARHFRVTGLDFEAATIAGLREGRAPIFEPGLNELIAEGQAAGRLHFTDDPAATADADVLWLTLDTPVNDHDESDVDFVLARLRRTLAHLRAGALVLISAQLPVGTCRALEQEFPQFHFACSPENLRLGKAIEYFLQPDRIVCGFRDATVKPLLERLFAPFTTNVLWMRTESAEMVKHGLNGFLALSITFANELGRLCEVVGADGQEVAIGLKSDVRIGPRAYLGPGGPFSGGTLARDTVTLMQLGEQSGTPLEVIPAIKRSNDRHRGWAFAKLQTRLGSLAGRDLAVLGLTYKPDTDTLRRSAAVELVRQLLAAGARVRAFDPLVKTLPDELAAVRLTTSPDAALAGADAAVICTEWPIFRQLDWTELARALREPVIVDANRFLAKELAGLPVEHLSVGKPA